MEKKNFFGGHAIPKPNFWFWHHIAAEFRHTLKNFEVGLSTQNFKKKIILFKKGVEVWGFDGTGKPYPPPHFFPSLKALILTVLHSFCPFFHLLANTFQFYFLFTSLFYLFSHPTHQLPAPGTVSLPLFHICPLH